MFQVIGAAGAAVGAIAREAAASLGPGSARFRVEPDQVFTLANRLDEIAADIDKASIVGRWRLFARPPGADKPSRDAADRLTETAFGDAGLVTRTIAYAEELRNAARALRDTATQYGLTDDTEGARFGAAEI
jgi:PE family